jgi:signal transduction histidine kinase
MGLGAGMIGVLAAVYAPGRACTGDQRALAAAVVKLAALVIERERLLREREEARASELALRQAKREMDEFLSIASHELRTPLTSIRGFIQLAEQRLKTLAAEEAAPVQPPASLADGSAHPDRFDRVRTVLERAEFQTGQMSRLINELLDASRVHASRLELHLARRDLEATVRDILEEQRLVWPGRAILLEASEGPAPVMIDAARIGQVLTNYVTNALKYAPAERPVIVRLSIEGDAARVSVRDFGPGLSAEEQGRIWERFFRSKQVKTQHGADGLGLGLYISRAIIERHGGRVGVESRPGEGATFFFVLPLAEVHETKGNG